MVRIPDVPGPENPSYGDALAFEGVYAGLGCLAAAATDDESVLYANLLVKPSSKFGARKFLCTD